ncbi:MAG: hypothetical protein ABI252_14225 [Candidatus Kapaibacterium sp.]|jgi:uncharacterized membrane protein
MKRIMAGLSIVMLLPVIVRAQFKDSSNHLTPDSIPRMDSAIRPVGLLFPASIAVQFLASEAGWVIPMLSFNANAKTPQPNSSQGPPLTGFIAYCIALVAPAILTDVSLTALHWDTGRTLGGVAGTAIGSVALVLLSQNKAWLDIGITSVLGTVLFYDLAGLIWPP